MTDISVTKEWACPSCDGTGEFAARGTKRVPCGFCNATGDQREMPKTWYDCPSRNREAYHESLR